MCLYLAINVSFFQPVNSQAEEERINREKQLEQEERLNEQLARINYETQREEKMRQIVKMNRCAHLLIFWVDIQTQHFTVIFLCCRIFITYLIVLTISTSFSMELRELESKLKSAYLNKERAAQIAEQEVMRLATMVSTILID